MATANRVGAKELSVGMDRSLNEKRMKISLERPWVKAQGFIRKRSSFSQQEVNKLRKRTRHKAFVQDLGSN